MRARPGGDTAVRRETATLMQCVIASLGMWRIRALPSTCSQSVSSPGRRPRGPLHPPSAARIDRTDVYLQSKKGCRSARDTARGNEAKKHHHLINNWSSLLGCLTLFFTLRYRKLTEKANSGGLPLYLSLHSFAHVCKMRIRHPAVHQKHFSSLRLVFLGPTGVWIINQGSCRTSVRS